MLLCWSSFFLANNVRNVNETGRRRVVTWQVWLHILRDNSHEIAIPLSSSTTLISFFRSQESVHIIYSMYSQESAFVVITPENPQSPNSSIIYVEKMISCNLYSGIWKHSHHQWLGLETLSAAPCAPIAFLAPYSTGSYGCLRLGSTNPISKTLKTSGVGWTAGPWLAPVLSWSLWSIKRSGPWKQSRRLSHLEARRVVPFIRVFCTSPCLLGVASYCWKFLELKKPKHGNHTVKMVSNTP